VVVRDVIFLNTLNVLVMAKTSSGLTGKPVRLFPWLHDISDFVNQNHVEYHPDSSQYKKYWEEQEIFCLEGKWGLDKNSTTGEGGWRYMPPQLYYYINLCRIRDEDENTNGADFLSPKLRDVEWILGYSWFCARGFSGFKDDENYTSLRLVKKIEDGIELDEKEKIRFERLKSYITKSDGNLKKYIDAKEYLYMTHPKQMGIPLYGNPALNLFILGSRGFGKSFFAANAVIGHEFNFYGKRYFDNNYLNKPKGVEIFVGAAQSGKSSDLLKKFEENQEYLKSSQGAWGTGDDFIPGYFFNNTMGSLKPNNFQTPYMHKYRYREGGTWKDGGTNTTIWHGIYTTENPQVAVGTRDTVMVIEEVGLLSNVLTVHGANETCQIRKNKFGSSLYIGTGGNMEKITESKIIFEDPISYGFLPFKDEFENRVRPIGLFIPAYYVDTEFKDKNGNTDIESSFNYEMRIRALKAQAASSSSLDEYMMSRPIVPSEMFLTPGANTFPIAKIRERIAEVEVGDLWNKRASIGELEWQDASKTSVVWREDVKRRLNPIISLNMDSYKSDTTGAIVIYEHPIENIPKPTFAKSLYKIVYDPVKDDRGGMSLASILVYKGFSDTLWDGGLQDTIVAEWIGRLDSVNDIHEIVVKIALYYNAKVLPELNIPDFVRYCKMNNYYSLLQPSPHEAISKVIANPGKKYDVGVVMSNSHGNGLKLHAEQLARQWLLTPWKVNENGKPLTNIDKIYSLRLLYELASYNREQNFDHVSALLLLGLWLSQEKEKIFTEEDIKEDIRVKDLDKYLVQSLNRSQFKIRTYV
jgi:hypothetical protein